MIISREIFNPDYALFTVSPGDRVTYTINPSSHCNPNHLLYFKFVGRLIGMSWALHFRKKSSIRVTLNLFQLKPFTTRNTWSAISHDLSINIYSGSLLNIKTWKARIRNSMRVWST